MSQQTLEQTSHQDQEDIHSAMSAELEKVTNEIQETLDKNGQGNLPLVQEGLKRALKPLETDENHPISADEVDNKSYTTSASTSNATPNSRGTGPRLRMEEYDGHERTKEQGRLGKWLLGIIRKN